MLDGHQCVNYTYPHAQTHVQRAVLYSREHAHTYSGTRGLTEVTGTAPKAQSGSVTAYYGTLATAPSHVSFPPRASWQ